MALPLLRRARAPRGLAKEVAVSAAMWTGSHGMRSTVNVSLVCGRAQHCHSARHPLAGVALNWWPAVFPAHMLSGA